MTPAQPLLSKMGSLLASFLMLAVFPAQAQTSTALLCQAFRAPPLRVDGPSTDLDWIRVERESFEAQMRRGYAPELVRLSINPRIAKTLRWMRASSKDWGRPGVLIERAAPYLRFAGDFRARLKFLSGQTEIDYAETLDLARVFSAFASLRPDLEPLLDDLYGFRPNSWRAVSKTFSELGGRGATFADRSEARKQARLALERRLRSGEPPPRIDVRLGLSFIGDEWKEAGNPVWRTPIEAIPWSRMLAVTHLPLSIHDINAGLIEDVDFVELIADHMDVDGDERLNPHGFTHHDISHALRILDYMFGPRDDGHGGPRRPALPREERRQFFRDFEQWVALRPDSYRALLPLLWFYEFHERGVPIAPETLIFSLSFRPQLADLVFARLAGAKPDLAPNLPAGMLINRQIVLDAIDQLDEFVHDWGRR